MEASDFFSFEGCRAAHTHTHTRRRARTHVGCCSIVPRAPCVWFVLFWPSVTVTGITSCRFVLLLRHYWSKAETRTVECSQRRRLDGHVLTWGQKPALRPLLGLVCFPFPSMYELVCLYVNVIFFYTIQFQYNSKGINCNKILKWKSHLWFYW